MVSASLRATAHFSLRCTIARRCCSIPISLVPHTTLARFLLIDLTPLFLRLIPKANHWVRIRPIAAVGLHTSRSKPPQAIKETFKADRSVPG